MKNSIIKLSLLVLVLSSIVNPFTFGFNPVGNDSKSDVKYNDFTIFSDDEYSRIEENFLIGMKSENLGLKVSSAYYLGEMKSNKALIPLLNLARNGGTEEVRIIAALSLYKIESEIGMHLLKGLSESDESIRVRNIFSGIYNTYASNGYSFASK